MCKQVQNVYTGCGHPVDKPGLDNIESCGTADRMQDTEGPEWRCPRPRRGDMRRAEDRLPGVCGKCRDQGKTRPSRGPNALQKQQQPAAVVQAPRVAVAGGVGGFVGQYEIAPFVDPAYPPAPAGGAPQQQQQQQQQPQPAQGQPGRANPPQNNPQNNQQNNQQNPGRNLPGLGPRPPKSNSYDDYMKDQLFRGKKGPPPPPAA